jgi:hypothetical protein
MQDLNRIPVYDLARFVNDRARRVEPVSGLFSVSGESFHHALAVAVLHNREFAENEEPRDLLRQRFDKALSRRENN